MTRSGSTGTKVSGLVHVDLNGEDGELGRIFVTDVGWMERKGEGLNIHHTNQTAFISEYSGAIDEKRTRQKNDKNRGRESGIGIPKTIISVTRIGGESNNGSLAGVGDM